MINKKMNWCIIFGHNFQPRYHREYNGVDFKMNGQMSSDGIKAVKLKSETYLYDICPRCGKIVTLPFNYHPKGEK